MDRGQGAWVIILPRDEALRHPVFTKKVRCDGNGRFEATGLRPGDYYAFAFLKREDQAAPEDPDCLRALVTEGAKVEVREGEISSVDLSPGPGCMF